MTKFGVFGTCERCGHSVYDHSKPQSLTSVVAFAPRPRRCLLAGCDCREFVSVDDARRAREKAA